MKWLKSLDKGFFERSAGLSDSVREHMVQLISCHRGAARCDANYGVDLDLKLFSFHNLRSNEDIKADIARAILHADRRIRPHHLSIEVIPSRERSSLDIVVEINLQETDERFDIQITRQGVDVVRDVS